MEVWADREVDDQRVRQELDEDGVRAVPLVGALPHPAWGPARLWFVHPVPPPARLAVGVLHAGDDGLVAFGAFL